MDECIRKLHDNIPERQPRSRLEPHIDVIREPRRKRRSYQEIFKEHLRIPVAPSYAVRVCEISRPFEE